MLCERKFLKLVGRLKVKKDLKMSVQRLLDDTLKDLGLSYEAKYEKAIYKSSRADALYPTVILEYKKTGALKNKKYRRSSGCAWRLLERLIKNGKCSEEIRRCCFKRITNNFCKN